jgi:hypothetical protein
LPIVAELQALGIDETTFGAASTEGGGVAVPEELALALVNIVCEAAETESAGM